MTVCHKNDGNIFSSIIKLKDPLKKIKNNMN